MKGNMADICLIIEGSYPYVTGGVASWIQHLIRSYREELTFAVVALTDGPKTISDIRYPLPDNVISFHALDLSDFNSIRETKSAHLTFLQKRHYYPLIERMAISGFRTGHLNNKEREMLRDILQDHKEGFFKHFMLTESGFRLLTKIYDKKHRKEGFVKYYYNWRNIHLMIWRVFMLVNQLPRAKIYHSPGTGFGGFLVCLMTDLYHRPSIITEHGIYIQEREMDLSVVDPKWLNETYMRDMWRDFFKAITKYQYETVTKLITLYDGNRQLIREYGADPHKVKIIPNGIQVEQFIPARRTRLTSLPPIIGTVGRVDGVKDIKTFLTTISILRQVYPDVKAYVVGPTDDEDYYKECLELRDSLVLQRNVIFTGLAKVVEYYEKFDVMLLTSIKEAMPLVVMEGMASGLPIVTTKVGACEELLYGVGDDTLGPAGYVAKTMDSHDIAMKTLRIINNPKQANQMGQVGIQRIEKYYLEGRFIEEYRTIYSTLLALKIQPEYD